MKGLAIIFSMTAFCSLAQQIEDNDFTFPVKDPIYRSGEGTAIILDESHCNFHTLNGRYGPFGKVLEADGYVLKRGRKKFNEKYLSTIKILVIANALHDNGPWINPTLSAFDKEEINALNNWVKEGGSLFLIADHMPFAGAAADLASSFGFTFVNGYAMKEKREPELFSFKQNNLQQSSITDGRNASEKTDSIKAFTGQGFLKPAESTPIIILDNSYKILMTDTAGRFTATTPTLSIQNHVQGAYLEYGKGRLVVFGEAAMFSAQLAGPKKGKMGMNDPEASHNPQLLLNLIHWLDRKL